MFNNNESIIRGQIINGLQPNNLRFRKLGHLVFDMLTEPHQLISQQLYPCQSSFSN